MSDKQGWVSIKERLPRKERRANGIEFPYSIDVLTIEITGSMAVAYFDFRSLDSGWQGYCEYCDNNNLEDVGVTHWQLLPDPPEVDDE